MYCKGKKPASREARNPRSWKAKKESPEVRMRLKYEAQKPGSLEVYVNNQEARKPGS